MLPNLFVTMALTALVVFLGTKINSRLITGAFIILTGVWAFIDYKRAIKYGSEQKS